MFTFVEIAVSVGVLVTLITIVSACVCGCKNSNQKSELVGTAGVVKIRFDEEAPSPTPTTPASIKQASTQNSQRSLPEIPQPVDRHDSGDTASEIYATVNLDEGNKHGAASTASTASTGRDRPHEHAYAKLQNDMHDVAIEIAPDESSTSEIQIDDREVAPSAAESVVISASVAISGQLPSSQELPYMTPPAPAPLHFSGDSADSTKGYTSISVREPLSNIRAQGVAKPQPPPPQTQAQAQAQTHYTTVSYDSDEMYAAIEEASAGEGSDTYAQIPEPRRAPHHEPAHAHAHVHAHHTRRSAPPEVGATSQATHSRQASSSSCSNSTGALGSPKPEKRQANSPLPPPPPAHHRISSTGDLHFNHDKLRRSLNEKHQRNNSCVSSSDFYGCNYPVEKHRFSSGELIRPLVAKELDFDIDQKENPTDNLYNSIDGPGYSEYTSAEANASVHTEQRVTESPSRNVDDMYAKVMKKGKDKSEETVKHKVFNDGDAPVKYRNEDPGYETIDRKKSLSHGYETIVHKERTSSQNDPTYETVKEVTKTNSTFTNHLLNKLNHVAATSGPNSLANSDPGYEHISKNDANASDSDPNYEVLRNQPPTPPYATIPPNYKPQPTYSTVNKKPIKYSNWPNNEDSNSDPNYDSMPNDPLYTTGSESDPNYESVHPQDPNYESVRSQEPNYESLRNKDPKYESVRSRDSKYDSVRSKKDPNYESVKYFEVSRTEPPYEKLNNATAATSGLNRSDSVGYEKIVNPIEKEAKPSINGADATVSDYFQV